MDESVAGLRATIEDWLAGGAAPSGASGVLARLCESASALAQLSAMVSEASAQLAALQTSRWRVRWLGETFAETLAHCERLVSIGSLDGLAAAAREALLRILGRWPGVRSRFVEEFYGAHQRLSI